MAIRKLTVKKYKVYFTIAELESLHDDTKNQIMKKYLGKKLRSIDEGDISPEFSRAESDAVQLGLIAPTDRETSYEKEQERRYLGNEMSKTEEREYEIKLGVPQGI